MAFDREKNLKNLGDTRLLPTKKEMSQLPGSPGNIGNNPMNANVGNQLASLSGYSSDPYGLAQHYPQMGGNIGPAENSNLPQPQVVGQVNNAYPYGGMPQPPGNQADLLESGRLAHTASTLGLPPSAIGPIGLPPRNNVAMSQQTFNTLLPVGTPSAESKVSNKSKGLSTKTGQRSIA